MRKYSILVVLFACSLFILASCGGGGGDSDSSGSGEGDNPVIIDDITPLCFTALKDGSSFLPVPLFL